MKATRSHYQFVTNHSTGTSYTGPTTDSAGNVIPGYDNLDIDVAAIQVNYTGTAVGSYAVLGSVDGVNFTALPFTVNGTVVTSIAAPANASPIIFDLAGSGVQYLQLQYTFTSGSPGTFSALVTGKRLGD